MTPLIYGLLTVLAIALFMFISFCRNSYKANTTKKIFEKELQNKIKKAEK